MPTSITVGLLRFTLENAIIETAIISNCTKFIKLINLTVDLTRDFLTKQD
jgi:hypothetical protein